MKLFKNGWEKELEMQHFKEFHKPRAYICSPLSGRTEKEILKNMLHAREYMYYASKEMCFTTSAPHAYLPLILNDNIPTERALALDFGVNLLKECNYILVCGNRISNGMRGEIKLAANLGITIVVFDENVKAGILDLLSTYPESANIVFEENHPALADVSPKNYLEREEKFKA